MEISIDELKELIKVLDMNKRVDQAYATSWTLNNNACETCSNNPKNGGSGICHCTLGNVTVY